MSEFSGKNEDENTSKSSSQYDENSDGPKNVETHSTAEKQLKVLKRPETNPDDHEPGEF